jgi:triacylglycerol lipase
MFDKKPLPRPSLSLVLHPEDDPAYQHFEDALHAPFETVPGTFSRINAWWLADASLLSYWPPSAARQIFDRQAHLDCVPIQRLDTQAYVASHQAFALVAFRGTQPDSLIDVLSDAGIALKPWDVPGEHVHAGFMGALDVVWDEIVGALTPLADRPVWFTGHSLGAAIATLAADRFLRQRPGRALGELGGVYTFGSPLVGDRRFVDGFNARCGDRSFRFVNDQDTVTRVPPPLIGYRHVNNERFVGSEDPAVLFNEPLIDHTPRRYAVLVWNALVDAMVGAKP